MGLKRKTYDVYKQVKCVTSYIQVEMANQLLKVLSTCYKLYIENGSRSPKKADFFHKYIKSELEIIFTRENGYIVRNEMNVKSINSSKQKRCDIVILKNDKPFIIFPVKLVMSSFSKNKNNFWENMTGELCHLKWANDDVHLIPINVVMSSTPCLTGLAGLKDKKLVVKKNKSDEFRVKNKNSYISNFEPVTYKKIENYNILKEKGICYDIVNYIIETEYDNEIGQYINKVPTFKGYDKHTKFRTFDDILKGLI